MYLLLLLGAGLAGFAVCLRIHPGAGLAAAVMAAAMIGLSVLFTRRRYREIAELSDCLSRIAGGDYSIDLRKYAEGELSILRDEIYRVTRTLSHQAQDMKRDKTFLADMLADISHQLKTPLTSVAMMTEMLSDPALPPEKRREFLDGVRSGVERIRWLVMSLLRLSRLDAGAVRFRKDPVSVPALVEDALKPLHIAMELRQQTLETELEDAVVTGDAQWLTEAFGNLLKNSVEHAPVGGNIRVRCGANPLYILFEVENDGPGIPPEDLPHIFDRFYRGKNAAPDSAGIGLALARSILTKHNAALDVHSEANRTRFAVKLYRSPV